MNIGVKIRVHKFWRKKLGVKNFGVKIWRTKIWHKVILA